MLVVMLTKAGCMLQQSRIKLILRISNPIVISGNAFAPSSPNVLPALQGNGESTDNKLLEEIFPIVGDWRLLNIVC